MSRVTRMARGAVIGVLAIAATMLVLPGTAVAGPGPHKIADKLERIAYRVDRIPDIHGLYAKDAAIDRLQARLHRLERISEHQRGRRARRNRHIIDRLQHRLRRMEHRVEARIERREARRNYRRGYRHGYWGYRTGYWGTRPPAIISPGFD
ncbi:MAG: hypothetical protein ACE5EU_04130 [Paracoccaceae bacterium]